MLEITVISPSGQRVRTVSVPSGEIIEIGRARECDVQLADPLVSRHHGVVEPGDEPGEWTYRDVGSTRGSFVEGERVTEVQITPGMAIRVGSTQLRFDSLAFRIGKELDKMMQDEESRGSPMQIEIIGSRGRHAAPAAAPGEEIDDQAATDTGHGGSPRSRLRIPRVLGRRGGDAPSKD